MVDEKNINRLAMDLRRSWGIDLFSPINIVSLVLEKIDKLTILWMEMNEDISGCCSKNKNGDFIIVINSNHSKGRQNFTLAHELYHLLYCDASQFFCCSDFDEETEDEADRFASLLLIPDSALYDYKNRNNIVNWSIKDIIKCEQFFQVSHKNMLCRLRREGWISFSDFENFKFGVKNESMRLGFNLDLYDPSKDDKKFYGLGHLIPLVEKVYLDDKISKGLKNEILIRNFRSDIVYGIKEDSFFD